MSSQSFLARASTVGLATTILLSVGCTASTTGEEGNLRFSYTTEVAGTDFDRPIAVGAKLDLRAYRANVAASESNDVSLNNADSSAPAILEVLSASGNTIVLEAKGEGQARISVDTAQGLSDAVTLTTRAAEVVRSHHVCLGEDGARGATYLAGQEIFLPFVLGLSDGSNLVGYGYYPLTADDAGVTVKPNQREIGFVTLVIGPDVSGPVALTSSVDDDFTMTLNVVSEADIQGARLANPSAVVGVGNADIFSVQPTLARDEPLCQADATFTVATTTPEICDVARLQGDEESAAIALSRQLGWISVEGKQLGDCELTLTYPNADNGAGITAEARVSVQNLAQ